VEYLAHARTDLMSLFPALVAWRENLGREEEVITEIEDF
jgi:hypothetical protein